MDQQEFMPESQLSESLQRSSEAQSQDRQTPSDNEGDVQFYNQSQPPEARDIPESNLPSTCENSPSPDSSCMQDQTTLMQQPNSKQNTQWQQNVDLLPGLGSISDKEISIEQNKQSTQKEHISTWVGLLLLLLVLLVTIPLVYSAGTALVRVLFVISLLPLILAFGLIVIFLMIALLRLLRTRIRQQSTGKRQIDSKMDELEHNEFFKR